MPGETSLLGSFLICQLKVVPLLVLECSLGIKESLSHNLVSPEKLEVGKALSDMVLQHVASPRLLRGSLASALSSVSWKDLSSAYCGLDRAVHWVYRDGQDTVVPSVGADGLAARGR